MKKHMNKTLLFLLIGATALPACVTQKKYDQLLAEKVKLDGSLNECNEKFDDLSSNYININLQAKALKEDTTRVGKEFRKTKREFTALKTKHENLEANYNNLLTNSGKLNRDLSAQERKLQTMQEDLEVAKVKNEELAINLQEREKRVSELEKILEEKEKAVNALKQKVSQALLHFKENDLTVEIKNGKVYVSLAEQLLFGSGSVKVDNKGESALQELAKAIKDQKDINIVVEGHTDNVPISKGSQYMNDNWDLSVIRATSIVKILTKGGVDPARITAAGKGEFSPLTSNSTSEGKRTNRRTEIILTPKLDELFQILDAN
jgi:chemotaxis protein MotB